VADSHWVVDFGVPAYKDGKPPAWARLGVSVEGTVYIGIDPFMYFEGMKNEPGMPDLTRTWLVRRILLETKAETTQIPRTDAWHDGGGHAHYVLECELEKG
jgi:hypothetical protein